MLSQLVFAPNITGVVRGSCHAMVQPATEKEYSKLTYLLQPARGCVGDRVNYVSDGYVALLVTMKSNKLICPVGIKRPCLHRPRTRTKGRNYGMPGGHLLLLYHYGGIISLNTCLLSHKLVIVILIWGPFGATFTSIYEDDHKHVPGPIRIVVTNVS